MREVLVAPHIERYVAGLVRLTPPARAATESRERGAGVRTYGASPRGGPGPGARRQGDARSSTGARTSPTSDVGSRVRALRHRLVMSFAAEAAGVAPAHIVERVLAAARRLRS